MLTVVAPDGAGPEPLLGSLPAAAATSTPELVIVACSDGVARSGATADRPGATADRPGVTVVRLAEDVGRPAAVNRAVAGLDAEIGCVVLVEPDARLCPGSLDALLAAASRHPRAGVVGARLTDSAGRPVRSGGPPVGRRLPTGPGGLGWVSGRAVLLRRSAWDSVDGYDSRPPTEPHLADIDLAERLVRAGWLIVHTPEAEVVLARTSGQGMLDACAPRRHGRGRRRSI